MIVVGQADHYLIKVDLILNKKISDKHLPLNIESSPNFHTGGNIL
jgi:hypothetical protein